MSYQPLGNAFKNMPGSDWAAVQQEAQTETTSQPTYKSNTVENVTFSGYFLATDATASLAILSDDGADVYINGQKVLSGYQNGQALPDLPHSLSQINYTFDPTHIYSIKIVYSNVFLTGPTDIDGVTLFCYNGGGVMAPVINVNTGAWQPNPAGVGQIITSHVTTIVDNPYQSPSGDSISQHWNWITGGVYRSDDGTSGSFTPYTSGYGIAWSPGSSTTDFSGTFSEAGFYIIKVTAALTYHDDTTGKDIVTCTSDGYIGGSAGDLAPPPGSPIASAMSAHQTLRSMDAPMPTNKGVPVAETIKLAGNALVNGLPQALTGQQITATLNGIPKGDTVIGYVWSCIGATAPNPIKTWDPTAPNTTGTKNLTQLVPLTSADTTGTGPTVNPFSFYDEKGGDVVTVRCSLTLKLPDGSSQTVPVQSLPITFVKPTLAWTVNPAGPGAPPYGFIQDLANLRMGANITWYPITITVPSPFSGGAGCIVQLTTPLRQNIRTSQNGKPSTYVLKIPDGNGGWVVPGVTAGNPTPIPELDTAFPYPSGYKEENDGSFTQVDTNYTWDINKTGNSGDLPLQYFIAEDKDGGGNAWNKSTASDTFTTWVMYMPSAAGSQKTIWVPLQTLTWSWNGTATKDATSGAWSATGSASTPKLGTSTIVAPPKWDETIAGQQYRP